MTLAGVLTRAEYSVNGINPTRLVMCVCECILELCRRTMTGTYTPQHRVYATPPHVNVSHFSFVYLSGEDHPLVLFSLSVPLSPSPSVFHTVSDDAVVCILWLAGSCMVSRSYCGVVIRLFSAPDYKSVPRAPKHTHTLTEWTASPTHSLSTQVRLHIHITLIHLQKNSLTAQMYQSIKYTPGNGFPVS